MFDICQTPSVTQENGIVYSPGYPTLKVQSSLCVMAIEVPAGKSLNIWMTDMKLKGKDSLQK